MNKSYLGRQIVTTGLGTATGIEAAANSINSGDPYLTLCYAAVSGILLFTSALYFIIEADNKYHRKWLNELKEKTGNINVELKRGVKVLDDAEKQIDSVTEEFKGLSKELSDKL
jgi:hypothetical protein